MQLATLFPHKIWLASSEVNTENVSGSRLPLQLPQHSYRHLRHAGRVYRRASIALSIAPHLEIQQQADADDADAAFPILGFPTSSHRLGGADMCSWCSLPICSSRCPPPGNTGPVSRETARLPWRPSCCFMATPKSSWAFSSPQQRQWGSETLLPKVNGHGLKAGRSVPTHLHLPAFHSAGQHPM